MTTPDRQAELIFEASELTRRLSAVMAELHGKRRRGRPSHPVESFDPRTGVARVYESATRAADEGYDRSCISACIGGKYQTHRGLIWRIPSESPPVGSPLDKFLAEQCHEVPGARTPYKEFCERFGEWLDSQGIDRGPWGHGLLSKMLPPRFSYGRMGHNIRYVGNLAWQPGPAVGPPLIAVGGKLKPAGYSRLLP